MNITVIDSKGRISCRPDTTWEREDKDFFVPDQVSGFSYAPVLFAKMSRAGKCIGGKFAERYYEAICYGVLLYAEDDPAGAFYDRSSILPAALYSKHTLDLSENEFLFCVNGEPVYRTLAGNDSLERIDKALVEASRIVSQRIGDIVAIELAEPSHLASREDGECSLAATWCENPIFDFKIIF